PHQHPQQDEPGQERHLQPDVSQHAPRGVRTHGPTSSSNWTRLTGCSSDSPMLVHRAYSGPAKTVSMSVTPTMPPVATVMILGMRRRSWYSSAAGAFP